MKKILLASDFSSLRYIESFHNILSKNYTVDIIKCQDESEVIYLKFILL